MMGIISTQVVNVHGGKGVIDKSLKKFPNEVHIKLSNPGSGIADVIFQTWSAGKIQYDAAQRLVQRNVSMAIPLDTAFVANSLSQSLPKSNPHIFDSVVSIYFKVAFGDDFDVDHAVARDLIQHMFHKGNPHIH